jgi:endonuclease/exonuclease/phosphatase family metal-dependent hydrolase
LIGERFWPLAVSLYLPPLILALPLFVLIPAALLFGVSRRPWIMLGAAVIILLWHTPFYWHVSRPVSAADLRVVTNNYAQNHGLSLQPWISATDPDIIALQDAAGQGRNFARAYQEQGEGRYVSAAGQFLLISKQPIRSAALLSPPLWRGNAVAAIFDVAWNGSDLAVYSVHMPSPRSDFAKLRGLGLVREALGRNRFRSDGMSFQEAMTARVALARALTDRIAVETRRYVVVGDFNMPSDGYVRGIFAGRLMDAFASRGTGFGFTFPGDARNPLALAEPWLRLDYIFAGPAWRVDQCRVEPARRSKHRAVFAALSPASPA